MRTGAVPLTRTAHIRSAVQSMRVRELQFVLADLNLARSGRKQELIDRIVAALQQFEVKATENASNHATSAYYNDLLTTGLRSVDTHRRMTRQSVSAVAPPPAPLAPPAYAPRVAAPTHGLPVSLPRMALPEPTPYGRPIPYPYAATAAPPPPPPPAAEILRASYPASLQGARCFCGSEAAAGKLVPCAECGLQVHAKCHQLVTHAATDAWYCELCRAALCDPFLRVHKTVLAPVFVKFNRGHVPFRIEYLITDQDINDLYAKRDAKQGSMTPGCLELQLRVFALKEELGTGTSWPTTSTITANGFNLPLVQRAPPGQSNPSKVLREQPVNLFPFTRVGRNGIELRTGENPIIFAMLVQIVEFRHIDELVREVETASASFTYEEAKKQVIRSFGGGEDEDEDDEIVTTSTILSVRCPLGLCVIKQPARGVACRHIQCFDLRTFLAFNKKARSRHYRCTICHNFIKAADLRIDPYLKKLLTEVQDDDELEEVEILPDGSWKRRLSENASASPPPKRVKQEAVESTPAAATPAMSTAAAPPAAPPAAAEGSATAPFEIDLSLSSDEDEDNASTVPISNGSTSSSGAGRSSTLSDDDVAIFTVDSDVWETSGGGGSTTTALGGDGLLSFPMDLFGSFPPPPPAATQASSQVDLSSGTNGSWMDAAVLPPPAPWPPAGADAPGLANAMALLSRNHPQVNNPFDQRRPKAPARQQPEVIDLLDSDSE